MPLITYQFHVFNDRDGTTQHLVKDSEVVEIVWRDNGDARKIVLVNGTTVKVSDPIEFLRSSFSFWQIEVIHNLDQDRHILNRDHIDHIQWDGSKDAGTLSLSNGSSIKIQMPALLQFIQSFRELPNP